MFCKERIAKAIRALSVPPVMVSVLILILAFSKDGIFRNTLEIVITVVLLGFVPILAYGLQKILPGMGIIKGYFCACNLYACGFFISFDNTAMDI